MRKPPSGRAVRSSSSTSAPRSRAALPTFGQDGLCSTTRSPARTVAASATDTAVMPDAVIWMRSSDTGLRVQRRSDTPPGRPQFRQAAHIGIARVAGVECRDGGGVRGGGARLVGFAEAEEIDVGVAKATRLISRMREPGMLMMSIRNI